MKFVVLAKYLKDMSIAEILQIFKPVLYLLPIIIVASIFFLVHKQVRKNELKLLFSQIEASGNSFEYKQKILCDYFIKHMGTTLELASNERTCAVCGREFSTKEGKYECPECNTRLGYDSLN